jgi:hypothetical protein
MSSTKRTFIGIDPSGGHEPFNFAALDEDCQLLTLTSGKLEEVFEYISCQQTVLVAVNSPHCLNKGVLRNELKKRNLNQKNLRGTDMRMVEYNLREVNIFISPTPSRMDACASWIQMGFDFYHMLEEKGFKQYPIDNEVNQWLETHPHAAYCALLGHLPLPKPTLEGRLQRQLLLHEQDMGIKDPMKYYEEITRHRLLKGVLPLEYIYTSEELDTLIAAFTAYLAFKQPGEVLQVGNKVEGQIVLPISKLMDRYT